MYTNYLAIYNSNLKNVWVRYYPWENLRVHSSRLQLSRLVRVHKPTTTIPVSVSFHPTQGIIRKVMVAVTSEITNPEACIIREMVAECQKHSFQGMRFETTTQRMVVKLLQYYSSIVPEA